MKVAHQNSHLNKSQEPNFFKQKSQAYVKRVPISFNFQVP